MNATTCHNDAKKKDPNMYFHMEPSENRPEVRKQLSCLVLIRATIFACGLLEEVEQKRKLKTHCPPKISVNKFTSNRLFGNIWCSSCGQVKFVKPWKQPKCVFVAEN